MTIAEKTCISVVTPCFNEAPGLPQLARELAVLRNELSSNYDVRFLFVDDGSTDNTCQLLHKLFGGDSVCTVLQSPVNRGIAAAILTGIREARTEIVCSIDSDCTYEPRQLQNLIPLLTPDVQLVTASPYHPRGSVCGVPSWRLALSKSASALYRVILRQKLHTYTSCFRVYRRSSVMRLNLTRTDFSGVAELIGKLDLQGFTVVECPARLRARAHGFSKARTVRVMASHVRLLFELFVLRLFQILFLNRARTVNSPTLEES